MADALLGVVMQSLNSLIQREFGLIWGVHKDMEKLSSTLSTIRDVLEDAEQKQLTDKPIANWLRKIKDAAYDADDVLDEWSTRAAGGSDLVLTDKGLTKQVIEFIASSLNIKKIIFRWNIGKRMKEIISRFDEIAAEKSKFHLSSGVVQSRVQFDQSRETSSLLAEEVVYGRDRDREKIIDILLSNVCREEDLSILPILGIGGLGKTTLAQWVYQDQRVVEHFDTRIWVCVSDDFEVKSVTKKVLDSLSGTPCGLQDLDPMQRQLREKLSGKKFLLVLDDVWNEDQDKWDIFKYSVRCGAKGSSIIITTRLEKVTEITGTLPPCRLTYLSEEDCLRLFNDRAFGKGKKGNEELEKIGKEIVKKCGGVPLAAKTLGGMMFSTREVNYWLHVRDSEIWELPQDKEDDILPALRLSYNHLPSHWRQCFAYCSLFPKDFEMDKKELIHLWMGNGFVQSDGRMEMEDVGAHIFNELWRRSFFQEIIADDLGNISTFKMHDLMHDLACSVSANDCKMVEVSKSGTFPKGIRHISLVFELSANESSNLQSLSKPNPVLRTQLLLADRYSYIEPPQVIFQNFNSLRALDVKNTEVNELPVSIGKMKSLRYLNLSKTRIRLLPKSICDLKNLQSLKLRDCDQLQMLPKNTSRMKGLRHLDVKGCSKLTEIPIGMGQLTQLQTLSLFIVGSEHGRKIKELQALKHLRGELNIRGLEQVRNSEEAKEADLKSKNLSSLKLSWSDGRDSKLQEEVLEEGLEPHPILKALKIKGYNGEKLPSWMPSLRNLAKIKISDCSSCTSLPALGQLPLLRFLSINGINSVKCIGAEFYGKVASGVQGFQSLEKLEIRCMLNLEEWLLSSVENPRHASFPSLETLTITRCPKLTAFPFLPCLQDLYLADCNEMILRSVGNLNTPCLSSLRIEWFWRVDISSGWNIQKLYCSEIIDDWGL